MRSLCAILLASGVFLVGATSFTPSMGGEPAETAWETPAPSPPPNTKVASDGEVVVRESSS
jgi:hypothetical protein